MSTFLVSQLFRCSLHFNEIDGENFRNFQKICFDEVFDSRLIFDEERMSPCFLLIKRNFIYSIKINLIPWLDRKVRTSANFYSDTKKSVSQKRVITLRSFISLLVRKSFEIVFFFSQNKFNNFRTRGSSFEDSSYYMANTYRNLYRAFVHFYSTIIK